MPNQPTPVILSDEQVAKMQTRVDNNEPLRLYLAEFNVDVAALCQTVRALRDDPRRVWDEHPNRDGSGKKCTECGFDNRFHAYKCFFHHPSLKISEEAFNAIHDEKMATEKENTALREQLAESEREWKAFENLAKRVEADLREQLAHHAIELENESREMQKWNNRANQLAIEGQELRQRLAQVEKERDDVLNRSHQTVLFDCGCMFKQEGLDAEPMLVVHCAAKEQP